MKATLTQKGQITIPVKVRRHLNLKAGDVLEFDEKAPFLKASKAIPAEAWDAVRKQWTDPWPGQSAAAVLNELRGEADLPPEPS